MKKAAFILVLFFICACAWGQTSQITLFEKPNEYFIRYNNWVIQGITKVVNISGFENGILDPFPDNSPQRVIYYIIGDFIYTIMIARNSDIAPVNLGKFTVERLNKFIASKEQILLE